MKPTQANKWNWQMAILSAALLLPTGALQADDDDDYEEPDFEANEVVVKLDPAAGITIETLIADYAVTALSTVLESAGIYLLGVPEGGDAEALLDALENDTRLLYAEPNYIASVPQSDGHVIWAWSGGAAQPGAFPDELAGQAALANLGLPTAHGESTGAGVVVAVLDTGVDFGHPNLAGKLLAGGYDYVDDDNDPQDWRMNLDVDRDGKVDENYGHGTHVAGAVLLNAPDARILPLRVLDSEGRGNVFTLAEAIERAVAAGAHIINLSLGLDFQSGLLEDVIDEAEEAGVLVVAAAGNANSEVPRYPAAYDTVLGVASVDVNDLKSNYTNWGWWIGVTAPGEALVSAYPGETYAAWSGTSMAAPLVSGQAALLKALNLRLSGDALAEVIGKTALNIDGLNPDWQGQLGAGRIDIMASVQAVLAEIGEGGDAIDEKYGQPISGSLAALIASMETSQEDDLNVRVTGSLGAFAGEEADDDVYQFTGTNGTTVLLELDATAALDFVLQAGLEIEVIGELERTETEGAVLGIGYKLEAVWVRLANGVALDIGASTAIAGSTITDWMGYYWPIGDGWNYHPSKGILYSAERLGDGDWIFSLGRLQWLYVRRDWYPYIYATVGGWHYLIGSPYGEYQQAYSFEQDEWIADFWR